ncbi:MAG TPA: hypothetical protein VLY04_17865 [Bryobacteraceae bacterium]|nr:hypothetical protein [Bryobacteraceae bacterium]
MPALAAGALAVVNAASYTVPIAPDSLASGFGGNLASAVSVQDSAGVNRPALIYAAVPGQVNFQVPPGTAPGTAIVTVTSTDGSIATGSVQIAPVAPGIFAANENGQGTAAAIAVPAAGYWSLTFSCGAAPLSCVSVPIVLDSTVLELYGTGIRGRSGLAGVSCVVGGVPAQVLAAGPQGTVGLDQVNVMLPDSLANHGEIPIVLTVDGVTANTVIINTGAPPTTDFYVATNGSDGWSGTLPSPNAAGTDGPFATLARAQQAERGLLASAQPRATQPRVQVRTGTYSLSQPLTLTAADSGSAAFPVLWENYPGETAVISGGRPITGWTPSSIPGAWEASVAGFQPFEQLWSNGQRRYRVRVASANASGYFYNLGTVYVPTATGCTNSNYKQGYSPSLQIDTNKYECFDRFFFQTGDINPNWSGLSDPNRPIEIVDFEDWTIARMRLQSIGLSSGYSGAPANSSVAYLAGATVEGTYWGFLPGHRYLIEAVKEALSTSTPGEWYADTDSSGNPTRITYVPAAGEDFSSNPPAVTAPQTSQIVVANGVSNVTFRGLTFSYTNWLAGNPGYSSFNGSEDSGKEVVPAALSFTNSSHITLDSVTVSQVGGWAAEFVGTNAGFTASAGSCSGLNPGNCNNAVINSVLTDLGAGGLRLGGEPAAGDTDANVAQYNLVYNTAIAGGDRLLAGAAITVGDSHHNMIDHNDIYDSYNQGINLGNSLNFDANGLPNWTHDNQVTYNHIYLLGQGVTSDMGAVHTATGLQTGNVIEYNSFHDITHDPGAGGYGGWGIYFDQGSSFLTAKFNLVYNTSATGFTYNHSQSGTYSQIGTPNVVANNIFAFGTQASIHRNLDDGALNFTFRNNIVYWDRAQPISGPPSPQIGTWNCSSSSSNPKSCFDFEQNLYYSTADPNQTIWRFLAPGGKQLTLAQWQAMFGEDSGSSVNVDPLFMCADGAACGGYDFRLQAGSQAPKLINFQPFDPRQAGRVNPAVIPPTLPPAFPLQLPAGY